MKNVFVTVGTTKFPKLIDAITSQEVIETLLSLGITFVQVQTGTDFSEIKIDPKTTSYEIKSDNKSTVLEIANRITLQYDTYFENFEEQIVKSDLVISHAGAGSCLEVLHKQKPLVVVINDELMDNHQIELAEELEKNGFLYYSTCNELHNVLKKDFGLLKSYPQPKKELFSQYLDKCMGFTN